MDNESRNSIVGRVVVVALVAIILYAAAWGALVKYPEYKVWRAEKYGEAVLAQSEYDRQVRVVEAKAAMDAANFTAQADIIKARGIAKANEIIGSSLKDNNEYLTFRYIDEVVGSSDKEIIYIPTEAGIPILEATRMQPPAGVAV